MLLPQPTPFSFSSTPLPAQLYIENILALQAKAKARGRRGTPLQLAIMTSDDTHARTEALLRAHSHFGVDPSQIHLIKQEKVSRSAPAAIPTSCQCGASGGKYVGDSRWGQPMPGVVSIVTLRCF